MELHQSEYLPQPGAITGARIRVASGWIYELHYWTNDANYQNREMVNHVFVPDPPMQVVQVADLPKVFG